MFIMAMCVWTKKFTRDMIDLPQIAVVNFFLKISITSVGRNNKCSLSSSAVSTLSNYIHIGKLAHDPSTRWFSRFQLQKQQPPI